MDIDEYIGYQERRLKYYQTNFPEEQEIIIEIADSLDKLKKMRRL